MHFRNAASLAVLACAGNAAAEPKPYKLAMMPILGMGLMRRDTDGYKPEQTVCGDGADCAAACGAGYETCASSDSSIHCFNPAAKQNCCGDGTGNSCDDGFYCTHDHDFQTWCCPDGMDLKACAAAYSVKGGLESATPTTTSHTSTSSTSTPPPTTTSTSTFVKDTPTPTPTSTSSSATPTPTSQTTVTSPDTTQQPTGTSPAVVPTTTKPAAPTNTNAAGSNSVSALVLMAVGLFALF